MTIGASASVILLASGLLATGALAQSIKPPTDSTGEILVTATKRPERSLDVPTSITALRSSDLQERGYNSIKDYLALVPGVQLNQALGSAAPVIRGLSTGVDTAGALVGTVVDGAPIGASATFASGSITTLDLDPIDIDQVEVLKGPQGTLYGANTLGGLLSYSVAKPDLNNLTMVARGEISDTRYGGANYAMHAAASGPIIKQQLAIRVSGYVDRPDGFVDNNITGQKNQNKSHNWGINGTVFYEPTADFSFKLSGFYQRVNELAQDKVIYATDKSPRDGDLKYNDYLYPQFNKRIRAVVGTLNYDLGFANLSSVTSYQHSDATFLENASQSGLAATFPVLTAFGGPPATSPSLVSTEQDLDVKKLTEELRLTSRGNSRLQYVAAIYYAHENDQSPQAIDGRATDGTPAPQLDPALGFGIHSIYKEIAGYVNVTYKITPRLDVTAGLRLGKIDQSYDQTFFGSDAGAYNNLLAAVGFPAIPLDTGKARSSDTVKDYLATARYHFSDDGMIYIRFATGFRPGGPNAHVNGLPPSYNPDKTRNYEAGIKSKLLSGRATIQLAGYYMDWDGILVSVSSGGLGGYTNGGSAHIYGSEGTLSLEPISGLSVVGTLAYNHAAISKVDPAAVAAEGKRDPLPNSAKWSGSLSATYTRPIDDRIDFVGGLTAKFVDSRHSQLRSNTSIPDYVLPGYTLVDVHAGFKAKRVELDLFVRNLTDKRAQLSVLNIYGLNEIAVQRPRTIGAAVTLRY